MRPPRFARAVALVAAILALSACNTGASSTQPPATATALTTGPSIAPPTPEPTAAAAGATGTAIHLVKNCSTFTAEIPSYCTISSTDYPPIPVGATVKYLGPLLNNPYFLSSDVLVDDAHGNTATGYCIFDGRPTEERGFCTFWAGTGSLSTFTSILKVTIDSTGEWHLDGEYYGGPPSPGPS